MLSLNRSSRERSLMSKPEGFAQTSFAPAGAVFSNALVCMIILFAVSALTGLAKVAKSFVTGTNAPITFDICKLLTIYFQQFMDFRHNRRYNFLKDSDIRGIVELNPSPSG